MNCHQKLKTAGTQCGALINRTDEQSSNDVMLSDGDLPRQTASQIALNISKKN